VLLAAAGWATPPLVQQGTVETAGAPLGNFFQRRRPQRRILDQGLVEPSTTTVLVVAVLE